jgi:tetratricopeptide (TPR) repeat protein
MAIKGSLSEASLADVVQLLALGMKSGCLSVADRSRLGQIFFERGRVTFARIVNRRDRLGDLLVRDGLLTADRLEAVLGEQARRPDSRLGEMLIDQGLLTKEQLDRYIVLQIEEAVFHLFTWSRGSFFFEAGERPDERETTVSISPDSLLLEAARRVDEWSLIEKKIPSLDLVFTVDRERLAASGVALTPEQERIVPLLDGTRSVQHIVDATGLTEFDTGRELFGLIQAGFARNDGRRQEDEGRAVDSELIERRNLASAFYRTGMLEDAAREFLRLLELNPHDAVARFHLALIQIRERRFGEAVDELKRLLEVNGPDFGAFMNLALALRMAGRPADALLALDAAEAQRPDSPLPFLERGVERLAARQVQHARRHFDEYRRRIGGGKSAAAYFYFAGLASALGGDLAEAESLAREGLRAHPRAAPLFLLGGLISERRGDYETAEKLYRRGLETDATLPQTQKNLGDLAYRRSAFDEALPLYQRASELDPDLGEDLWVKLGNLHYKQRNREGAVRCWSRALEMNPGNHVVRNNLEIVSHAPG